jgi:hypothetical protein
VPQDERSTLVQQMQELQAQVEAQDKELQQYADNDPEALAKLTDGVRVRCMCCAVCAVKRAASRAER